MPKKVKVEVTDDEGTTYSLSVHGAFSQDKVMKVMELLDLLDEKKAVHAAPDNSTTYGRLLQLVETNYKVKEFSSADIARDYEEQNGLSIPLSTVSTYLSRLTDRGTLRRQKFGNSWVYRLSHLAPDQLPR